MIQKKEEIKEKYFQAYAEYRGMRGVDQRKKRRERKKESFKINLLQQCCLRRITVIGM